MGDLIGNLLGGDPSATKEQERLAEANFTDFRLQKFLPPSLRFGQTGDILKSGIQGIGDLIRNPGGLSPNVSEAILPRLAIQSENIAQNFRGIRANQRGAATRSNVPLSIRGALDSALNVAQERAQRGARREALTDSESLRRQDLGQTFQILDSILQFMSSGRGQAITGLGQAAGVQQKTQAANLEFIGTIIAGLAAAGVFASASRFKEDLEPVSGEEILSAISTLPVYEWSYKGEGTRHIGPMAEDFLATFGLGNSPDSIHVIDAVGTLMAATQALAHKVKRLEAVN